MVFMFHFWLPLTGRSPIIVQQMASQTLWRRFYNWNFRLWKEYPLHYLSTLSIIPWFYIFIKDVDGRWTDAATMAGLPVSRLGRKQGLWYSR